jgi:hypothetical protein
LGENRGKPAGLHGKRTAHFFAMTAILIILGVAAAVASFMVFIEMRAPSGYEDENGFHYGDEPRKVN